MATRRPAPRPKRGGEEFARSLGQDSSDSHSTKKPRFDPRNPSALLADAPEEDAILDADEIGKRGQQTKRNAVNIDGYQSDSSNEGFDARAEAKAKSTKKSGGGAKGSKQEDENDMFADLEDGFEDGDQNEELAGEGKKKKKDVRFIGVDEIEGQVASSKSGGHVSADLLLGKNEAGRVRDRKGKGRQLEQETEDKESSSEDDVGDEGRAELDEQVDEEVGAGGKKKHAPKIDAFNLRGEQEEGGFDEQMNFVRKARDPDAVHDSWLEGLSKKDMKKAKDAADKRDEELRQKLKEADAILTSDLLATLIPLLERSESVLEALARLGKRKEKRKPKWQKNKARRKNGSGMDLDDENGEEEPAKDRAEVKRLAAVEAITGAADQLMTRGQVEIYEAERELLVRQYRKETGEDWEETLADDSDSDDEDGEPKLWEYRWSDKRDGGDAYGPYDGAMMVSWNDAGYFGDGVEFRQVGSGEPWNRRADFS
ncbi:hypothetical protein MMC25_000679 [Agyrium rufum]|nr:hypothetical protein [Agyrium rufum]